MRHGHAPVTEEPGEDGWRIIAAGTVTKRVFPGERLVNVTAKKAWAFPCSKIKPFQASKVL